MSKQQKYQTAITPTRNQDYPEWYQQVVKASELADQSIVRGCMVIKPWGFALWENIKNSLDAMFKQSGVQNAYFPMFIPLSFFEKEAEHVEGFAKECAVVTHHKLVQGPDKGLTPAGRLNEPLIVRPTSETIIGDSFAKWVSSYRDLPLLINQWANVVRWEMRTRIFLRTSEFLWQEGHTAHASPQEALERTTMMLDVYEKLAHQYLAMPVIKGRKTETERFPGAVDTLCIEALMQDRKALQAGTSHFLGQNFAKASQIKFQTKEEHEEYAWTTSWGTSTRLIGGLIMTHGDDDGIILPPRVAGSHLVLLPIIRKPDQRSQVMEYTDRLARRLRAVQYHGRNLEVVIDDRKTGGKNWDWIKKGIPVRVEIGPRDIASNSVFTARRDQPIRTKQSYDQDQFVDQIADILDDIQNVLFKRAQAFQQEHTYIIDTRKAFYEFFTPENIHKPEIHGGLVKAHWCGQKECEAVFKEELKVTIRCIPLDAQAEEGTCVCCGQPSKQRVIFAKAY